MKKFYVLLCIVFSLLSTLTTKAQNEYLVIKRTDGTELKYTISSIDKVYFSQENTPSVTTGQAVDLGLSVKWASYNIGATKPEEYGGYYAWGETEEKTNYTNTTYQYYDPNTTIYMNIGSNISGTEYDVAHVKWGGNWKMPTLDQIKELINSCTWKWTVYNGVNGCTVTGPNGNSIFLPAAGYRDGTDLKSAGEYGSYATVPQNVNTSIGVNHLYFTSSVESWSLGFRYCGYTVRPVTE